MEVTPEMERKDREQAAPKGGIFASWNNPGELDPSLVPPEKQKMLAETQQREQQRQADARAKTPNRKPSLEHQWQDVGAIESKRYFLIPSQLMACFKKFLMGQTEISVNLTLDQAQVLLQELGALKTPKNMADAKVIIKLSDQLEEWVNDQ